MTLQELIAAKGFKVAELARLAGCNKSYLHHVMDEKKPLSRRVAIRIYRQTGERVGPIAQATPAEIDVLERLA